jgi:hypothetical protein
MTVPDELNNLIDRLNQELNEIEQISIEGIDLLRIVLKRFPDNIALTELFAFLSVSLFYAQRTRSAVNERLTYLSNPMDVQEIAEDFALELGRAVETKIKIIYITERLLKA